MSVTTDKLTTELLTSIAADPVISYYLKSINSIEDENDGGTPAFREKNLRLALKVVRGAQATETRRHDIATFRMYKRLLFYYYVGRVASLSESNAQTYRFGNENIANALNHITETIVLWHNYIKNNLLHLLLKETFLEIMLEWVKRYHYLYGRIVEAVCKYMAAKLMTLLFCNLTYLEEWWPELQNLITKIDLTQSNKSYKSLVFSQLCIKQIIHDIQSRFSPLVHKFVLNSLQLEDAKTVETLQEAHMAIAIIPNTKSAVAAAQKPNSANAKDNLTDTTKLVAIEAKQQLPGTAERNKIAKRGNTLSSPIEEHKNKTSFQYYSDYSRIQNMPQQLRLHILHAANQTRNFAVVGKRFNVTPEKVSLITRFRQEILNEWKYNPDPARRLSHLEIEHLVAINDVIKEWYRRAVHANASLTDDELMEKANELKRIFKLEEFEVSARWLKKFKINLETMKYNGSNMKTAQDTEIIVEDLKWSLPAPGYALFKRCLAPAVDKTNDIPLTVATANIKKLKKPKEQKLNRCLSKTELKNYSHRNVAIKKFCKNALPPTITTQLTAQIKTYERKRGSTKKKTLDEYVVDIVKQELIEVDERSITLQNEQSVNESMTHDELLKLFTRPLNEEDEDDDSIRGTAENCQDRAINEDEHTEAFQLMDTANAQTNNFDSEVVVKVENFGESQSEWTKEMTIENKANNEENETGDAELEQLMQIKVELPTEEDSSIHGFTPCFEDVGTQITVKNEPIDWPEECITEGKQFLQVDKRVNSTKRQTKIAIGKEKQKNVNSAGEKSFETHQLKVTHTLSNIRPQYEMMNATKRTRRYRELHKTYSKSVSIDLPHTNSESHSLINGDKHQIDMSKLLTATEAKFDHPSEEFLQLQKTLETATTTQRRNQVTPKPCRAAKATFDAKVFTVIPYAASNAKTYTTPVQNASNETLQIKIEKPEADLQIKIEKPASEPQIKIERIDESNVAQLCSSAVDVKLEELPVECTSVTQSPANNSTTICSSQDACVYLNKLARFTWRMKNKDALILLRQIKQCLQDDIK